MWLVFFYAYNYSLKNLSYIINAIRRTRKLTWTVISSHPFISFQPKNYSKEFITLIYTDVIIKWTPAISFLSQRLLYFVNHAHEVFDKNPQPFQNSLSIKMLFNFSFHACLVAMSGGYIVLRLHLLSLLPYWLLVLRS